MIIGIGSDIVDIRRIEAAIEKHGERFLKRIYTDVERARSDGKLGRIPSYAKRFAAKEACSKALGTGMNRGVAWRNMGVVNRRGGAPTMELTGGALTRLQQLLPAGHEAFIHLTITDEPPYAQAYVIIEARPASSVATTS
jgi:holo-[acyl-carrier protein] synthase